MRPASRGPTSSASEIRGAGEAPEGPAPDGSVAAAGLSPDAIEASRLLLELIHATYPARGRGSTDTSMPGHVPDGPPTSRAAIRASIHLYLRGGASMGELAAALGMSNGWASRVVEELARAGLVARASDPVDRRIVHVALTPAAMDFVASAYRWRGEAIERALADLDADGRAAVRLFLARAIEELQPAPEARPPDRVEAS